MIDALLQPLDTGGKKEHCVTLALCMSSGIGMKKTPLKRKKRLNPVSNKNVTRTGKLGIVRLRGEDLETLRQACFDRDDYICQKCECAVYDAPYSPRAEMAH